MWEGESGIDLADAAAAAGLAIGEEAAPSRLAKAERDLLARYHRDGYLGARVLIRTEAVAGSSERDVTVFLNAGEQARIGLVRLLGDTGLPADQLEKALKLPEGAPLPGVPRAGRRARRRRSGFARTATTRRASPRAGPTGAPTRTG